MIKDSYLYSSTYSNINEFNLNLGCTYIYAHTAEGRSYIARELMTKYDDKVCFVELNDVETDMIYDKVSDSTFNLRDNTSMYSFFKQYEKSIIYIDSSGLSNRICASLLKNAFSLAVELSLIDIRVIYAEPETYQVIQFSTEGIFNDLSENIRGIDPLPGFANIIPYEDEYTLLVALLGFEGGRFKYILENIELNKSIIHPVIGVPGFRPEYPFVAYWGNRRPLDNRDIWPNITYASANSIAEIYLLLNKLFKKSPSGRIKIAPIGTKPHAIGAILFAIKHPIQVEIIYDNPVRKKKKTDGVGKIIDCSVYELLKNN